MSDHPFVAPAAAVASASAGFSHEWIQSAIVLYGGEAVMAAADAVVAHGFTPDAAAELLARIGPEAFAALVAACREHAKHGTLQWEAFDALAKHPEAFSAFERWLRTDAAGWIHVHGPEIHAAEHELAVRLGCALRNAYKATCEFLRWLFHRQLPPVKPA